MWVVLQDGPGPRVLGLPVHTRNARVARRAGAQVADAIDEMDATVRAEDVLVVPPTMLLTSSSPGVGRLKPAPTGNNERRDASDAEVVGAGFSRPDQPQFERRDASEAEVVGAGFSRPDQPRFTLIDVSTPVRRRAAEWALLRQTVKPTDGWMSRHVNRPQSRLVSYALLKLGWSANHASIMTLLVGLIAAVMLAQPGPGMLAAAGILFQLASVLDGVDGEIARVTLTESPRGAELDAIVDQITYVACFAGLAVGWVREGAGMQAAVITAAIGAGLVLTLVQGTLFVRRYAPNASFVFIDTCVRRAARDSGGWALGAASLLFALLRRDLFAVIFLVVSLTGSRAAFPALVTFGLLVANATLLIYRGALVEAAHRERAPAPATNLAV